MAGSIDGFTRRLLQSAILGVGLALILPTSAFAASTVVTASPSSLLAPGGSFSFTVTVSGPYLGGAPMLTALVDNKYGNLNGKGTCSLPQSTFPYTCSYPGSFTGSAGASQTNTVSSVVQSVSAPLNCPPSGICFDSTSGNATVFLTAPTGERAAALKKCKHKHGKKRKKCKMKANLLPV